MNRNVKIAKELARLAKSLVAMNKFEIGDLVVIKKIDKSIADNELANSTWCGHCGKVKDYKDGLYQIRFDLGRAYSGLFWSRPEDLKKYTP